MQSRVQKAARQETRCSKSEVIVRFSTKIIGSSPGQVVGYGQSVPKR